MNGTIGYIPEPIKDKASRTFKATKDKIMGLYKRVKGKGPDKKSFKPVESETRIKLIENQTHVRT